MDQTLIRLTAILEEMAALSELAGENPFKARAFLAAVRTLETHQGEIAERVRNQTLVELKGIGKGLAEKIGEFYASGRITEHEELKARVPSDVVDMLQIPNLGPKKILKLYRDHHIDTIEKLETACREQAIRKISGFGPKSEEKLMQSIAEHRTANLRFLHSTAADLADRLAEQVRALPGAARAEVAGSVRRAKEIVGDIDIVVARDRSKSGRYLADTIADLFDHERIIAHGETKVSVSLVGGPNVDFRIVTEQEFACALLYFTGSKEHNTELRSIAKKRGLKLNEYGLLKGSRPLPCKTETDVYKTLGLRFIPPTLREMRGEIEAARTNRLPRLIKRSDLRGTLHVHTTYSDGVDPLTAMIEAAKRLKLEYIGISDHSQTAAYAGGLKLADIERQHSEIDRLNEADPSFIILKGIESDILADGSLDYPDETLDRFDFIIGSIHGRFNLDREEQTERIIRAIENPYLSILGHTTARLLLRRKGIDVDLDRIIDAAIKHGVVVEFNCHPNRLDLDWRDLRKGVERGLITSINPDAHSAEGLKALDRGIGVAQKAWLEPAHVLNTRPVSEVKELLCRRRRKQPTRKR